MNWRELYINKDRLWLLFQTISVHFTCSSSYTALRLCHDVLSLFNMVNHDPLRHTSRDICSTFTISPNGSQHHFYIAEMPSIDSHVTCLVLWFVIHLVELPPVPKRCTYNLDRNTHRSPSNILVVKRCHVNLQLTSRLMVDIHCESLIHSQGFTCQVVITDYWWGASLHTWMHYYKLRILAVRQSYALAKFHEAWRSSGTQSG